MKGEGGLDKRKAYILATVVYEYIATAEPVGSRDADAEVQPWRELGDRSQRDGRA